MTKSYNDYVIESFRDNSIRSVTLIDDQVVPYHKLISDIQKSNLAIESGDNSSTDSYDIKESANAAEISEFFLKKQILCDIDNAAENIDHEKIRKSDLIILDYHLVPGDSEKSRQLVYSLSTTPHMNLVVIYTTDDLQNVWSELALSLYGGVIDDLDEEVEELWDDLCEGNDIPYDFEGVITKEVLESLPFDGEPPRALKKTIAELLEGDDKKHSGKIARKLVFEYLSRRLGIKTRHIPREIQGSSANVFWLQVGSVFVTFYRKGESGAIQDEPKNLWKRLKDALIEWGPTYYQLMLSEIQNKLEDQNLPMDKLISKGKYEQSAMLWSMLHGIQSENTENPIQVILKNVYDYLYGYSLSDEYLHSFLKNSAKAVDENLPPCVVPKHIPGNPEPENKQEYEEYQERLIQVSLENFHSPDRLEKKADDRLHVVHAFNKELSCTEVTSRYITTGMLLRERGKKNWYLCVSPSCNTVAGQLTDKASKRMTPNRAMRFLELEKCNLQKALEQATQSRYIFTLDNDEPIALGVVHAETNLPIIEVGIVHEHDTGDLNREGKLVSFIAGPSDEEKIVLEAKYLEPVSQVKESYAARFQNIQSHYEGRIGVDFVSL